MKIPDSHLIRQAGDMPILIYIKLINTERRKYNMSRSRRDEMYDRVVTGDIVSFPQFTPFGEPVKGRIIYKANDGYVGVQTFGIMSSYCPYFGYVDDDGYADISSANPSLKSFRQKCDPFIRQHGHFSGLFLPSIYTMGRPLEEISIKDAIERFRSIKSYKGEYAVWAAPDRSLSKEYMVFSEAYFHSDILPFSKPDEYSYCIIAPLLEIDPAYLICNEKGSYTASSVFPDRGEEYKRDLFSAIL